MEANTLTKPELEAIASVMRDIPAHVLRPGVMTHISLGDIPVLDVNADKLGTITYTFSQESGVEMFFTPTILTPDED